VSKILCVRMKRARRRLILAAFLAGVACLPWRYSAATPLTQEEMTAAPALDQSDAFFAADQSDLNLLLSVGVLARSGLPTDSADEGLREVARSVEEDGGLQQILRVNQALETVDPLESGLRNGSAGVNPMAELPYGRDDPSAILPETAANPALPAAGQAAAAQQEALAEVDPERTASGAEVQPTDGQTLREALRGLVGTHSGGASFGGGGDDDPAFGLGQAALDSQLLGSALNAFISRTAESEFEPTFSLFGLGQFSVNVGGGSSGVVVSEGSSGLSLALTPRPPAQNNEADKVDFFTAIRRFLATPTGTLTAIAGSVVFVVWCMVRMATLLRR
jgi:hypothetical protein